MGRRAALLLSTVVVLLAPGVPAFANVAASVNAPGSGLSIRAGGSTYTARIGRLPHGAAVVLVCHIRAQAISGSMRRTDVWNRLPSGGWVSDAYIRRAAMAPPCGPPVWVHPLPGFRVQGGFRTAARPTHIGVDLMSYFGTPIRAASAGLVVESTCNIHPGGSCDQRGSPSARGCGWYVKIVHAGRIATLYCHMWRAPVVNAGQYVQAGQYLGMVGSSGRSSYPHLHFEVHVNAPPTGPANAIDPRPFMASAGAALG